LRRWRADLQISYSKLKDECDELAPENIRKQNEEDNFNAIKKETLDDSGNVLVLSTIKPEADDSWISTGATRMPRRKKGISRLRRNLRLACCLSTVTSKRAFVRMTTKLEARSKRTLLRDQNLP
jgi:hypothetical protein